MPSDWPAWLAVGLHLLLGAACPACGAPGWAGCPACRARILNAPVRQIRRSSPVPIWVAGSYRTPLAELVVAHKDAGAWQLTGLLAELLARAARPMLGGGPPCLVPVPSNPALSRFSYFSFYKLETHSVIVHLIYAYTCCAYPQ